jgi:predicted metal-dependent enzyme (double-stranded beta helix superfamily)
MRPGVPANGISAAKRADPVFDLERFAADCRAALDGERSHRAVRDIVGRAVSEPGSVVAALGELAQGGIQVLHRAPDLTILNVLWAPKFVIMPHDHAMWAVIGVYAGREDNILWRRLPDDADGRIEAAGAKSIAEREAVAFGSEMIHSVVNPLDGVTGAIHVYGGDFFAATRSEWDPASLSERPYDLAKVQRMFAG